MAQNGYSISINQKFVDSQFHHMYLNGDRKIGMYIPKEIHLKYWHNGDDKLSLRELNKKALEWLTTQEIITGDIFNPDNLNELKFQSRAPPLEKDNVVHGFVKLKDYNKSRGIGMIYISALDYKKLKPFFGGKMLEYKFDKEKNELIIKPFK
jgi:hypothetical protein